MAAWRHTNLFSPKEQAALAWAESLTQLSDNSASEAEFKALQALFLDVEITDLTMAVALMNAYNRMAISMRQQP